MRATLLRVAWWSILLGLGMEIILVGVAAGAGQLLALKPILADLVQKVSWSVMVCMGLAVGTAAAKARPAVMGLAGLMAAPLAFHAARALHKSAVQALAIAGPAATPPSVLTLAVIKALEYACLGALIAWLSKRGASVKAYVAVGLVLGALTGAIIVGLGAAAGAKPPMAALLVRVVNELLFPVGCSLVLFAAETMGRSRSA